MMLADLGQGYHLVPLRDHCFNRKTRQLRPVKGDYDALDQWQYRYLDLLIGKEFYDAIHEVLAERVKHREEKLRIRKERMAERRRESALHLIDPMAIQATKILYDALIEMRE